MINNKKRALLKSMALFSLQQLVVALKKQVPNLLDKKFPK